MGYVMGLQGQQQSQGCPNAFAMYAHIICSIDMDDIAGKQYTYVDVICITRTLDRVGPVDGTVARLLYDTSFFTA